MLGCCATLTQDVDGKIVTLHRIGHTVIVARVFWPSSCDPPDFVCLMWLFLVLEKPFYCVGACGTGQIEKVSTINLR